MKPIEFMDALSDVKENYVVEMLEEKDKTQKTSKVGGFMMNTEVPLRAQGDFGTVKHRAESEKPLGGVLRYITVFASAAACIAGVVGIMHMNRADDAEIAADSAASAVQEIEEVTGTDAVTELSAAAAATTVNAAQSAEQTANITGTAQAVSTETQAKKVTEQTKAASRASGTAEQKTETNAAPTQTTAKPAVTAEKQPVTTAAAEVTKAAETKNDGMTYEQRQQAKYNAILKAAITDKPYDEVLHEEIADLYYFGYRWIPHTNFIETLLSWNERHPIELLRKIDDHRMYGIQKMQQGGLLYTFYQDECMTHTAWMSKALSYSDFDDIHIGDTSQKVAALEPVTEHWAFRAMATDSLHPVYDGFTQELLLKDGFLEIHYNMEEKPNYAVGDWIITDMKFYPDFKVEYDYVQDVPWVSDYSILPEDYPANAKP